MTNPCKEFRRWIGVWTGRGAARTGEGIRIRAEIAGELEDTALCFHIEAFDVDRDELRHGIRIVLGEAPSGLQRAIGYSTLRGMLLPERTPDDEGVVALNGATEDGGRIELTFVEEEPHRLLFTWLWRASEEEDSDAPRMSCRLRRMFPAARRDVA